MDNLHSGIIRLEVSHYQKARGTSLRVSLRPLKERNSRKLRRSLRGMSSLSATHRPAPPRYGIMRRTQLSIKQATWKKGEKKSRRRGEKPLTGASCDLSAAAVQNARNKDFYHARPRRRRTLKRICNFREIPLTRLRCTRLFVRSLLIPSFRH